MSDCEGLPMGKIQQRVCMCLSDIHTYEPCVCACLWIAFCHCVYVWGRAFINPPLGHGTAHPASISLLVQFGSLYGKTCSSLLLVSVMMQDDFADVSVWSGCFRKTAGMMLVYFWVEMMCYRRALSKGSFGAAELKTARLTTQTITYK